MPVKTEECFNSDERDQNRRKNGTQEKRSANQRGRGGRWRQGGAQRQGSSKYGNAVPDKQENPVDAEGKVMRCHVCDSTRHFAMNCQHRQQQQDVKMSIHLTLVAGNGSIMQKDMLCDTLGKGILDSACTKTVAGVAWINEFLDLLTDKKRIQAKQSEKRNSSFYRFGDGAESMCKKCIILPITIAGNNMKLKVDVVQSGILLLISKPSMQRIGMSVDFAQDEAWIGKQKPFKLCCNTTGHYTIPVSAWADESCEVVLHLQHFIKLTEKEKEQKTKKLHRQFAHASKERLLKLLRS